MSNSSIMSVREMIDNAFGDPGKNTVNHKLIQTILYLLARQLRLLERRVEIEIGPLPYIGPDSTLSITELKIHAMQKKKKKIKPSEKPKHPGGGVRTEQGTYKAIGPSLSTGRDKNYPARGTKENPGTRIGVDAVSEGGLSRKTLTSEETSTESMTRKSTIGRAPLNQLVYEKAQIKYTDKDFMDKHSTSPDKTSSDNISKDITSSDKTTTGISSTDKTSTDKASTDKTSTDKTSTDKPSTDLTSTDKTSTEKSTTEKLFTGKWTDDTSTKKVKSPKRPTTDTRFVSKRMPEDYQTLLETIEERRERELRIIHQRADSFEEPVRTPTPMASLDSVEAKYENLLVVERVPSNEAKARATGRTRSDSRGRVPQLSVVTQDQFETLAATVHKLQQRFEPIARPEFPDNAQLMQDLRKGASLTDAMAALQLSARLEATEKTLGQMLSIVTDLASQSPGIDLSTPIDQTKTIFGAKGMFAKDIEDGVKSKPADIGALGTTGVQELGAVSVMGSGKTGPKGATRKVLASSAKSSKIIKKQSSQKESTPPESPSTQSMEIQHLSPFHEDDTYIEDADGTTKPDRITYEELENAMQELQDEFLKKISTITNRNTITADKALKLVTKLAGKLDEALNLGNRMAELESLIADYAEQINVLDTGLSSQMTNYQEQLTQMQHDLEIGLETMAEVLANTGGDTAAVAELNSHFTSLQADFDNMTHRQKELKLNQNSLSLDLEGLWKQLELLRETKSDRDEVTDALRDKAGIGALNGLVSLQQFEAVRGDFEKRIGAAYDKFNNQEIVWQKAIDELVRELNEKAELIQVLSLKDDINKHLNILQSRLNAMMEIVGEPHAAAITKKLHRDAACLSCSTPAHMALEEPGKVPALPAFQSARQPPIGTEAPSKPKEYGDHGLCYPGLPIPHSRDPRAHVCQRYCGGSHTLLTNTITKLPPGITVTPALRQVTTGPGRDGKMYKLDETVKRVPCLPCNVPKNTTPRTSIKVEDSIQSDADSDMTPSDFRPNSLMRMHSTENDVPGTPPPPIEEY